MSLEDFIKSCRKRLVKNTFKGRWVYSPKKHKLVKDKSLTGLYACECGCNTFGNFDLYLIGNAPMALDCAVKFMEGQQ